MAKEREKEKKKEKAKKLFIGITWNCAAELKFLLAALLFLCSLAIVLQFVPSRFTISSNFRDCLFRLSTTNTSEEFRVDALLVVALPPSLSPPSVVRDRILEGGIIRRAFDPYGAAAYNFILMSAYRGGLNTFAVVGLASKPLNVFGKPSYQCEWVPELSTQPSITTVSHKILPDWGFSRVYTVVRMNCTFPVPVGHDSSSGRLVVHASTNDSGDLNLNMTNSIEALTEAPKSLNMSYFTSPPKYDFLYCGSSLFGNLSPQRVREWLAYHVKLFGEKSHFVIPDAGGVHSGVMEVLRPWMEKGYATLQDIRQQERFDGYYHTQLLVLNDCLHRYRFMTKWMFFFDVDEFIFVAHPEQKWGFEKLVYRDVKRGVRRNQKYAIQPRSPFAIGVHRSQNIGGKSIMYMMEKRIKYFHYHGTITQRGEPFRQFVNTTDINFTLDGIPYVLDTIMQDVAGSVKTFELTMIASRLQTTPQ